MAVPFEDAMSELMAEYEKARNDLAKMQTGVAAASGKARSKNRMLTATVNGRGEVTELKFHNQSWRNMAPGELSKVIIQTIKEAQTAARKQTLSMMTGFLPEGMDLEEATSAELDWSQVVPQSIEVPSIITDFITDTPGD